MRSAPAGRCSASSGFEPAGPVTAEETTSWWSGAGRSSRRSGSPGRSPGEATTSPQLPSIERPETSAP